ncbi:TPA: mechanosensitive ion channel [Methanosarcinaceae archaeon]|nr:mechanosensitive ion channel [Methanosarcinaceae archaeon]
MVETAPSTPAAPPSEGLFEVLGSIDSGAILSIILIFLLAYFLARVLTLLLSKTSEMAGLHRIKLKILIPLVKVGIYGIAAYYIFIGILELSKQDFLILGGLFGAALGLGLKDFFLDIAGGLVITFENPYQIGDKIRMGEYYGEVSDIGFRATTLVTPDDDTVTAPNSLIFTESVASANNGASEMMVVIDLYISGDSEVGPTMRILREAVVSSKYVYISEKCPVTLLHREFPFYTRLRAKAYVNDLRLEFEFESDVLTRARAEFRRKNIKTPEIHLMESLSQEKGSPSYIEKWRKPEL